MVIRPRWPYGVGEPSWALDPSDGRAAYGVSPGMDVVRLICSVLCSISATICWVHAARGENRPLGRV